MSDAFDVLMPLANDYSTMMIDFEVELTRATDDELLEMVESANRTDTTNCWWAIYAVAPIVRDAVQREQFRRRRVADTPAPTEGQR